MGSDAQNPMDAFEAWLRRRVAQAVAAGQVPAHLSTELRAEIGTARERPQAEGHAAVIQHIADVAGVDEALARPQLVFPPRVELELAGTPT